MVDCVIKPGFESHNTLFLMTQKEEFCPRKELSKRRYEEVQKET